MVPLAPVKLSIIIPVLNEAMSLPLCLKSLNRDKLPSHELLVVDGGSQDQTKAIASRSARLIESQPGRAVQMNHGAKKAQGEWLFFLHADSRLSEAGCVKLKTLCEKSTLSGGCFTQKIDHPNPFYLWIAWTGNLRARVKKIFYGDQGIFVRRDLFERLGGYPEIPIMEDVSFSKKLKQAGQVAIQKEKIVSSPRRWEKTGILKTTLLHAKIKKNFARGVPPEKIKTLYLDVR